MPRDDALNVWQVGTGPEKGIDFCDKVLIGGFCGITLCMIVQSHIDVYILYINTVYIYIHTWCIGTRTYDIHILMIYGRMQICTSLLGVALTQYIRAKNRNLSILMVLVPKDWSFLSHRDTRIHTTKCGNLRIDIMDICSWFFCDFVSWASPMMASQFWDQKKATNIEKLNDNHWEDPKRSVW